jgi:hypothetical protein
MAVLNDRECTKLLKTHHTLHGEWQRLEGEYETARRAVIDYQKVRDKLELSSDPKKQKDREAAQRQMESMIKKRNTFYTQSGDAHKIFSDLHHQIERNHGLDFLDLLIQKANAGKTTWD